MRDAIPLHHAKPQAAPPPAIPAFEPPQPPTTRLKQTTASRSVMPVAAPAVPSIKVSQALDRSRPVDMDRRNWQRLKRGQMGIDARLDLHGLSQEEAHRRLDSFLLAQQARGARCVLVITGVGQRNGGILRNMTPRWLDTEPNRSRILAYSPAQTRDGGHGALYVLLRRRR
ncbi:MAG: Smr/MutS family protein [Geminicoccaceae bacterium]|nr:Smr/MutS family protein [Geminicoccaceae bacterium]